MQHFWKIFKIFDKKHPEKLIITFIIVDFVLPVAKLTIRLFLKLLTAKHM